MTQWMTLPAVMGPSGFLLSIIMVAAWHTTQHQIKSKENSSRREGVQAKSTKKTDAVFLNDESPFGCCPNTVGALPFRLKTLVGIYSDEKHPIKWLTVRLQQQASYVQFPRSEHLHDPLCRSSDKPEVSDGVNGLLLNCFPNPHDWHVVVNSPL